MPCRRRSSAPGASYDRFEGRAALRSWLYRIATNVCLDMLSGRERRARPMDLGPARTPVIENLNTLPEVDVDPADPGRPRRSGDGDPADVAVARETIRLAFVARAPAPAAAPARGADPLRGAALEGGRGRRAARHERRVGQQRAAARAGHARGRRTRAADADDRAERGRPGAARPLRRGVRAVRHGRADRADPRGRDAVDAAVRPLAAGPRGHPRLVVRARHRLRGLARDPGPRRPTARRPSASTSRARPAAATTRGRCRCSSCQEGGSSSSRSSSTPSTLFPLFGLPARLDA